MIVQFPLVPYACSCSLREIDEVWTSMNPSLEARLGEAAVQLADEFRGIYGAQAMKEVGLDLSQEFPKPLTDEVVSAADVVITMGCGDACPVYPGKRYLDWEVEDPSGKTIEEVRAIRDEIEKHVEELVNSLGV